MFPNDIFITLPNAEKEFGTLTELEVTAQRMGDPDWRRKLINSARIVRAWMKNPEAGAEALIASGITVRVCVPRERLPDGFGLAEATFDGLRNCVTWE